MLPASLQIQPIVDGQTLSKSRLHQQVIAEFVGTALIVFLGCGSVRNAVLCQSSYGVFQVGIVWGLSVFIAISLCGRISGAHFNPIVSITMALYRSNSFSARKQLLPYVISQFFGSFLGAFFVLGSHIQI